MIDGQNVACNEGGRTKFSMKALKSAIDFFVTRGDDVIAIVPSARLDNRPHNKHMVADNVELLQQLKREQKVVYSPSGVGAHDDHFIIQVALQYRNQGDNVAIVSNDHFREMGKHRGLGQIDLREIHPFVFESALFLTTIAFFFFSPCSVELDAGRLQTSASAGRNVDAFIRECRLPFMCTFLLISWTCDLFTVHRSCSDCIARLYSFLTSFTCLFASIPKFLSLRLSRRGLAATSVLNKLFMK